MTSYVPPKKNTAAIFYLSLPSYAAAGAMQANPTLVAGDVQVSTDGAAFGNITTLPTVTPAAGASVKVSLSAAEMNGDNVVVVFKDQTVPAEWCDTTLTIQTAARQVDDLAYPATSGRSMVVDAAGLVDANMVKAGPTGAGTAQTAGNIFAKVTGLTFTVANQVDVNVVDWKGATAPAMTGDAFARMGAPAGASMAADVAAVKADTANIYAAVDTEIATLITSVGAGLGAAVAALPTANANADALLDRANGIETGFTLRQSGRLWNSVLLGKVSGAGTATEIFRDLADAKDRVTATVDASGNRTAITRDAT